LNDSAPTVSVIIPTYNRPELLRRAVESVLQQTFRDLEVIIVDEGSCEETYLSNAKTSHLDNRVRYVYKKENRGPAAARNDGIRMASGRYVAFLDDDDVWLSEKLEKQVQFMSSYEDLEAVCCDFGFIDTNGKILNRDNGIGRRLKSARKLFKCYSGRESWYRIGRQALYKIALVHYVFYLVSTAIVKRQFLVNVGLFDESLPTNEDWDLLIRLVLCCNFGYLDEVLCYARGHDVRYSQSRLSNNTKLMLLGHFMLLDKLDREVPDRFRHYLHAHAYQQYSSIIHFYLVRGDFSAAESIIHRFNQKFGLLAARRLMIELLPPIIASCLMERDFSAPESTIYRITQKNALLVTRHLMIKLYVRIITGCLTEQDFSATEPIIYRLNQKYGLVGCFT